ELSLPKKFLNDCIDVALFIAAIDVVKGIPFGQTSTQFCAFPQLAKPLSSIKPARRSLLFISPVGRELNNLACDTDAGPFMLFLVLLFCIASSISSQLISIEIYF